MLLAELGIDEASCLQRSISTPVLTQVGVPSLTLDVWKPSSLRRNKSDSYLLLQQTPGPVAPSSPLSRPSCSQMDDPEDTCAICLGTTEGVSSLKLDLHCGHTFCLTCLGSHAEKERQARRPPWCPLCRCELSDFEIRMICPDAVACELTSEGAESLRSAADLEGLSLLGPTIPNRSVDRNFRRAARRAHLKRCPNCDAAIQKNGGCDHMECQCGFSFNWSDARTVVPCRQLHLRPRGFSLWCTTCPGCSKIATAKLGAVRTGIVVAAPCAAAVAAGVAVVGAATAATAAAVTATVPAVVCAPLAAVYEPVRRIRGRRSNRFVRGMGSGVRLVKRVVEVALDDSD